jgi:hypothetical protein
MGVPCLGLGMWGIRWVIPSQEGIDGPSHQFRNGNALFLCPHEQAVMLLLGDVDVCSFHGPLLYTS